jgi:hypothetical protein
MALSLCAKVKLQVPPLRFATVGMTNFRVAAHLGSGGGGWTESNKEVPTPTKELIWTSMILSRPRSSSSADCWRRL